MYIKSLLFISIFFIFYLNIFPQTLIPDWSLIYSDIKENELYNGEKVIILNDSTKCFVNFENGVINGRFKSYYADGNIKAKGFIDNNNISGKWKLYSKKKKNKIILRINSKNSYKIKRIKKGFLNYKIFFGRGKVNSVFANLYKSEIEFKNGKKNSNIKEIFIDGSLRATYAFSDNYYDGDFNWYWNNGKLKMKGQYEKSKPIGIWKYYNNKGEEYRNIDYNLKPYTPSMTNHYYVNEHEVVFAYRLLNLIPNTHFLNQQLFENDSNGVSLYSILNDAFIFDETMFYNDFNLKKIIFSSSLMPKLHGNIDIAKPVMFVVEREVFYSIQHSNIKDVILKLSVVLNYVDNEGNVLYRIVPFLYFPQMYKDLGSKEINNISLKIIFDKMLNDDFYSIPIKKTNIHDNFIYQQDSIDNWIEKAIQFKVEKIDFFNSFLLMQMGL